MFESGTYKQQFEYNSFSPSHVNQPYQWQDNAIPLQLEEAMRIGGYFTSFSVGTGEPCGKVVIPPLLAVDGDEAKLGGDIREHRRFALDILSRIGSINHKLGGVGYKAG